MVFTLLMAISRKEESVLPDEIIEEDELFEGDTFAYSEAEKRMLWERQRDIDEYNETMRLAEEYDDDE